MIHVRKFWELARDIPKTRRGENLNRVNRSSSVIRLPALQEPLPNLPLQTLLHVAALRVEEQLLHAQLRPLVLCLVLLLDQLGLKLGWTRTPRLCWDLRTRGKQNKNS